MTIALLSYVQRTWDEVIGGFFGCTVAYTIGVFRNAGTARFTYAVIAVAFIAVLFPARRSACLDIQSYELAETVLQLVCAFFSSVKTRSGRRVSRTALLIIAYTNWVSYGAGQVSFQEEVFGTSAPGA